MYSQQFGPYLQKGSASNQLGSLENLATDLGAELS